jgi:hypothetical protein
MPTLQNAPARHQRPAPPYHLCWQMSHRPILDFRFWILDSRPSHLDVRLLIINNLRSWTSDFGPRTSDLSLCFAFSPGATDNRYGGVSQQCLSAGAASFSLLPILPISCPSSLPKADSGPLAGHHPEPMSRFCIVSRPATFSFCFNDIPGSRCIFPSFFLPDLGFDLLQQVG